MDELSIMFLYIELFIKPLQFLYKLFFHQALNDFVDYDETNHLAENYSQRYS